MKCRKTISGTICLLVLAIGIGHAEIPSQVNYQGRLTDSHGVGLDTTADLTFRLYKDPAPVGLIWEETHYDIVITDGLFSVLLGSIVPFDGVFDGGSWYMTIQVESDPESVPPVPIVMVPYAYRSVHSDTARYAKNASGDFVQIPGDTMTGELHWDANDDGSIEATLNLDTARNAANLRLYTDGVLHAQLWGERWGEIALYDESGDFTADLTANGNSGGTLYLKDSVGGSTITLRGGGTGTDAAWFAEEAIDASEIFDEPGVATDWNFGDVAVMTDTQYVSLVATTIDIPAPGYVLLMGSCAAELNTWRDYPFLVIQIGDEESPSGGWHYAHAVELCLPENDENYATRLPVSLHAVFYRDTPGLHTFYLQASLRWGVSTIDDQLIGDGYLAAVYIPTSYGEAVGTTLNPSGLSNAEPIPELSPGGTRTVYKVDYRDLELQVARTQAAAEKARADAEAAQRRLLEAQLESTER